MNFNFLNVPVQITPSFWVFLLFFTDALVDPSIWSIVYGGVLVFSVLVHEYGHALTAMYFGSRAVITLESFGGNAKYSGYGITPKQEFFITLNGPLFQSLLIFISYYLYNSEVFVHQLFMEYILFVCYRLNTLMVLLNLIPLLPLDGGHLARYFMERKFGENGRKFTIILGLISVGIVAPYLFYTGELYFGGLICIFAFQNYLELQKMKDSSAGDNPFALYMKSIEAIKNQEVEEAKTILSKLIKSKDPQYKHLAIESLAKIYVEEKETEKAYELLLKSDYQMLKEGKCLLCKLAFEKQNYELIAKYSREIYRLEPTYEIALLNSKAFEYLKDYTLSKGWFNTASAFKI